MKQIRIALKTLAIKARVYNQIRQAFFKGRMRRWQQEETLKSFTPEDKIKFFDELFAMNWEAHWELNDYKRKRQDKAEILRLREERKKNLENTE
jgi:hypothetical protein